MTHEMMKRMAWIVAVASLTSFSAPSWGAPPKVHPPAKELFQANPHFSADQTPAQDQPLQMEKSGKAVQESMADLDKKVNKLCAKKKVVYRVNPAKSSLKVTAFKNFKIPVVGKFTKFDGYLAWKEGKAAPKSALLIDAGSWDSGVPERDNRVKHFLLHADEHKTASGLLKSKYEGDMNPGIKNIRGKLRFRGKKYEIHSKNKVTKDGDNWVIQSLEPYRLTAKIPKDDMLGIMKLCNHESLTPAVDLEWNLVYEPACGEKAK